MEMLHNMKWLLLTMWASSVVAPMPNTYLSPIRGGNLPSVTFFEQACGGRCRPMQCPPGHYPYTLPLHCCPSVCAPLSCDNKMCMGPSPAFCQGYTIPHTPPGQCCPIGCKKIQDCSGVTCPSTPCSQDGVLSISDGECCPRCTRRICNVLCSPQKCPANADGIETVPPTPVGECCPDLRLCPPQAYVTFDCGMAICPRCPDGTLPPPPPNAQPGACCGNIALCPPPIQQGPIKEENPKPVNTKWASVKGIN